MSRPVPAATFLAALLLAASPARGEEPAPADSPAAAREARAEEAEFKPPSGFRARKRGEHVVYCRREEPRGTRFPTEVCYDEQAIREMLQATREDQAKIDQVRRTMATDVNR